MRNLTPIVASQRLLRKLRTSNDNFPNNFYGIAINYLFQNGFRRHYRQSSGGIDLLVTHLSSSRSSFANIDRGLKERVCYLKRFATASETVLESPSDVDLLSFIKSTLDQPEGAYHCWLNKAEDSKDFIRRDGAFLVLAGALLEDTSESDCSPVGMLEKIKALQQRYPALCVMVFQSISSICDDVVRIRLFEIAMKGYITFPILLSSKTFSELTDGACYILFKDFESPLCCHTRYTDLKLLDEGIKGLNLQLHNENSKVVDHFKSSWERQIEVIKEPYICSTLQKLLFYFPGCISVDEVGNRLFLSDTNHHRLIIFDGNGKILDCIGSSPGFEDGDFESAKLMRPAASFYHAADGCLYIVDSENHAIRKADMDSRVLETIYPTSNRNKRNNSLWRWIMDKLWMTNDDTKSENLDSESFLYPWHVMKLSENDVLILNRSFETSWIMDLASGLIKQVIRGFPKILENGGQMIQEKLSLLKQMPNDWLQCRVGANCSSEGIRYAGFLSSVATFHDHMVICDTVCQRIWKVSRESGLISSFQFSNFGILGLPYWLSFSLERVYLLGNTLSRVEIDHTQSFTLFPGRIDIQLNIDIPEDTELVEPLQEGCVWRQARGAAIEVSGGADGSISSPEKDEKVSTRIMSSLAKVGAAQQWYDELDSLASSALEMDTAAEEKITATEVKTQDERIGINCVVNASPGTSEVIILAALYLKMTRKPNACDRSPEEKIDRLANILNPNERGTTGRDTCVQYLLKGSRDVGDFIFVKPLHVRLQIDCCYHPKANTKAIVLTDSSIAVDVSLQ